MLLSQYHSEHGNATARMMILALLLLSFIVSPVTGLSNQTHSTSHDHESEIHFLRRDSKEEKFASAVCKAEKLLEALKTQKLEPSEYTDYSALAQTGYETAYVEQAMPFEEFSDFLQSIGMPEQNQAILWTASADKTSSNAGSYDLWLHPQFGLIAAVRRYRPMDPPKTGVWRPSDVMALAWKWAIEKFYEGKNRDIKWFLAENIVNPNSLDIIQAQGKVGDWPGKTWDMSQDMGKAILGSPNGISFAWMLMQHADLFPKKTVSKVQAYAFMGFAHHLIFYLDDVK